VLTRAGRVAAVFAGSDPPAGYGAPIDGPLETVDLGDVAILPGLVNAHTHLELSWMRQRIPPSGSMSAWASKLIALRREQGHDPPAPIADAIQELRAAGTALVGDVTNTLAAYDLLSESRLGALFFTSSWDSRRRRPPLVDGARATLERLDASRSWRRSVARTRRSPCRQRCSRRSARRPVSFQ
jgi:cytosine/adenosine deaminase-related metal-dependent hydrolase